MASQSCKYLLFQLEGGIILCIVKFAFSHLHPFTHITLILTSEGWCSGCLRFTNSLWPLGNALPIHLPQWCALSESRHVQRWIRSINLAKSSDCHKYQCMLSVWSSFSGRMDFVQKWSTLHPCRQFLDDSLASFLLHYWEQTWLGSSSFSVSVSDVARSRCRGMTA